jgi:hypothetical protein
MPDDTITHRLISLAKAAIKIDKSTASLRRWSRKPNLGFPEAVIVNNRIFFWEDELDAWLEGRRESKSPTVGVTHPIFTKRTAALAAG